MRHFLALEKAGITGCAVLLVVQLAAIFYGLIAGFSPLAMDPDPPVDLLRDLSPIGDLVAVVYQRTVDGDTIKVSNTERGAIYSVRLFGVDCEEPKLGTAEAFRAALFTADALENAAVVYLEYDDVALTDHYGRHLAWVWYTPPSPDSPGLAIPASLPPRLLNLELLDSGLARPYSRTQSTRYHFSLEE